VEKGNTLIHSYSRTETEQIEFQNLANFRLYRKFGGRAGAALNLNHLLCLAASPRIVSGYPSPLVQIEDWDHHERIHCGNPSGETVDGMYQHSLVCRFFLVQLFVSYGSDTLQVGRTTCGEEFPNSRVVEQYRLRIDRE
jgi:hypothetical protein